LTEPRPRPARQTGRGPQYTFSQEKVARVTRAMLTMTKFDVAEIEKAYADA
jgi:hypothetical protein